MKVVVTAGTVLISVKVIVVAGIVYVPGVGQVVVNGVGTTGTVTTWTVSVEVGEVVGGGGGGATEDGGGGGGAVVAGGGGNQTMNEDVSF